MINSRWLLLSVSVIAILVFSTIFVDIPAVPRASAQQKVPGANWEYANGNSHATNFNPQTQITKDNINFLELKWVYPIPTRASAGGAIDVGANVAFGAGGEGSITPPLVVDGIVYFLTNHLRLFALEASTGKLIWSYQVTANVTDAIAKGLPIGISSGHIHSINYINGWIIIPGLVCDVIAINALTGKVDWTIEKACLNIPGSVGFYSTGFQSYSPLVYKRGNTLIYVPGVVDGFTGRGFVAGYDLNAVVAAKNYDGAPKWRFFTVPPAGGDTAWGEFLVRNCRKIWIQSISSCDIDQNLLRNDWGNMGLIEWTDPKTGKTFRVASSGTGTVWGSMSIDEETGYVYMGTSQPTLDWNATYRPGPNLFSNTVLAINANNGELVWAHQSLTHDLWDWDCSWNTVFGTIGARKAVLKVCKNGLFQALDAATGELIWYFYPPSNRPNEWNPLHQNSKLGGGDLGPKERSIIGGWDPRNPRTLTLPWMNYPSKDPIWTISAGGFGSSDLAFDGKTIYSRVKNVWEYIRVVAATVHVGAEGAARVAGRATLPLPSSRPANNTLYAVDAATGKAKWSIFFEGSHRAGPLVSGGLVYFSHSDGNMYAIDADAGKIVWSKFFGIGLGIYPTIGATADGKMRLFQLTGAPGALMVFGLPDKLPEPQVITKEVVKEVIKEVPKEVIKEVTKEVIKEVPKEVIKEVTKEVTKTVTVETISPVSYAAIGIGVVLVVMAGVLFTRRKKA